MLKDEYLFIKDRQTGRYGFVSVTVRRNNQHIGFVCPMRGGGYMLYNTGRELIGETTLSRGAAAFRLEQLHNEER